jgi:lipid II:glycine glycyltransferase (peptidoglycan interpeptide bridge formation enzyme)
METIELRMDQKDKWNEFILKAKNGHLLQSWQWGQLKKDFGWKPFYFAVLDNKEIKAACLVLRKKITGYSFFYAPRGPVFNQDYENYLPFLFEMIHKKARQEKTIYFKIEPGIESTDIQFVNFLKSNRFIKGWHNIQPINTFILDLSKSEQELLSGMRRKHRQYINKAKKAGIKIIEDREGRYFNEFYKIMMETGQRAGFDIHSKVYYQKEIDLFGPNKIFYFAKTANSDEFLATLFVFSWKDKITEFYGGMTDKGAQTRANYLLKWHSIQMAKERGFKFYDFWGGIPKVLKESSPMYGVWWFKVGFGGELINWIGPYDFVYRPIIYKILNIILGLKKRVGY